MTEIEKARLDLKTSVSLLQLERGEHEAYRSKRTVEAIEALIDTKLAEHADRIRAIAREEIEAAAPWVCGACGAAPSPTCPHRGVVPQCGVPVHAAVNQEGGEANSRLVHTGLHESPPAVEAPAAGDIALARRLAEALHASFSWGWGGNPSVDQQIVDALTEAREAGLIE